jgi:hypothetical protein
VADVRQVQAPKLSLAFDDSLSSIWFPNEGSPVFPNGFAALGVPEVDPLLKRAVCGTDFYDPAIEQSAE